MPTVESPDTTTAGRLNLLSFLLFQAKTMQPEELQRSAYATEIWRLDEPALLELMELAHVHHVAVRILDPLAQAAEALKCRNLLDWARERSRRERQRLLGMLPTLHKICAELDDAGVPVMVIKSLDHWPDVGSDIDLLTLAPERRVVDILRSKFKAELQPQSWSDRLAHKWNLGVPGLGMLIELHAGRLGQTGEHVKLANSIWRQQTSQKLDGISFQTASAEGRIVLATLQRMYRHFYLRLCDVLNLQELMARGQVDFARLRPMAESAGIWTGVASYLETVSTYLRSWSGEGLPLPEEVVQSAQYASPELPVRARFLRVPILPLGVNLYFDQLRRAAARGDWQGVSRLGLFPCLAAAAAVSFKLTGSDKGIW